MNCHDCKKVIGENVWYMKYVDGFVKCQDCHDEEPILKNFRPCEVYSRVVGYLRPVAQWNKGKQEEYKDRVEYK